MAANLIIISLDHNWRTENYGKRTERKQQEFNDIDWEDLYHRNQLSSFRVCELKLYINHHTIGFKGKKDEKVRVGKACIGKKGTFWQ